MNDSVREELKDKISVAPKSMRLEARPNPPVEAKVNPPLINRTSPPAPPRPKPPVQLQTPAPAPTPSGALPAPPPKAVAASAPAPAPVKTQTSEIMAKPTSPTLVEFQHKNATVPEWRLQLQNAVRKRIETGHAPATVEIAPVAPRVHLPTSGANALKAEIIEEAAPVAATAVKSNPKLENALRRIERSRRQFLTESAAEAPPAKAEAAPAANKNFPFYIATKNAEVMPKPAEIKPAPNFAAKPRLEELPLIEKTEKAEYDTNKLKPLPNAAIIASSLERTKAAEPAAVSEIREAPPVVELGRVKLAEIDEEDDILEIDEIETVETEEEIEDLAPFSMRFNAGLFDLIIGAFTAAILLSPLMLSGGNWFSPAGLLAFLVTNLIVMFIYLTTAIGFFGKTFGMKLFSLETIDVEENDYPSLHQAAVSSSVYLFSLALGGIGFLPIFFNSEKRAAHDLLSGTIIVKEY
jgi:uncharacterized RDD family membrane protein YckC